MNGALKSATPVSGLFSNNLSYGLSVTVPLDAGGQISATCASATLVSGASSCALSPASVSGLSSGTGTSTSKTAALALQWTLPTATRLIAGSYSDTITITIAVQQ
jgi:spore coat protein U-like protein